jgi:hypothetical protein
VCTDAHSKQAPAPRGPGATEKAHAYRTRQLRNTDLYRLLLDHLESFLAQYDQRLQPTYGYLRPEVRRTLEEFIQCGDYRFGAARICCRGCRQDVFVPLSCCWRGLCPSCHAKRQLVFSERVLEEVLPDVPCRQWVLSLPKALRQFFYYDGSLCKKLSQVLTEELTRYMRTVTGQPNLEPAFVVWDHSYGALLDAFHPHQHVCATDGGFLPDGSFIPLPKVRKKDIAALGDVLRHRVLRFLLRRQKLDRTFRDNMLSWEHSGFSLDASRRIRAGRRDRLQQLLDYMSRHPFNPKRIRYDAVTATVRYRAHKTHARRNTDTIEVDAVEFIAILALHIPHARRHQFRYYGAAHPKVRQRLGLSGEPVNTQMPAVTANRGRRSWARLIWKVYGVDPMICPKCGQDRVILAVIFDQRSLLRILKHLDLPHDLPVHKPARAPPELPPDRQAARGPLAPVEPEDDYDGVDPDDSRWDCIDEPFETIDEEEHYPAQSSSEHPGAVPNRPRQLSILEIMNRWPGKISRGRDMLEKRDSKT